MKRFMIGSLRSKIILATTGLVALVMVPVIVIMGFFLDAQGQTGMGRCVLAGVRPPEERRTMAGTGRNHAPALGIHIDERGGDEHVHAR